jgi:hypothetical protein
MVPARRIDSDDRYEITNWSRRGSRSARGKRRQQIAVSSDRPRVGETYFAPQRIVGNGADPGPSLSAHSPPEPEVQTAPLPEMQGACLPARPA